MAGNNRIDRALSDHPAGLWPFLPAGYPDIAATAELLRSFAGLPIRGVELGFPFSDPIADGPIIQHAFTRALASGLRIDDIFNMVKDVRGDVDYPILAMVSASIVYRIGIEKFIARASAAGFDGLIVPDLSLEEAPELSRCASRAGLCLSMLIAPTTPADREKRLAAGRRTALEQALAGAHLGPSVAGSPDCTGWPERSAVGPLAPADVPPVGRRRRRADESGGEPGGGRL